MKSNKRTIYLAALVLWLIPFCTSAQRDVMMQGFYWDVPNQYVKSIFPPQVVKDGSWWDTLKLKVPNLRRVGFSGIWTPVPSKGNWGIDDMGYGVMDHYDLGEYFQRNTTETRFGSRRELEEFLDAAHSPLTYPNGMPVPAMQVYSDVVLNHLMCEPKNGFDDYEDMWAVSNLEPNGALKNYIGSSPPIEDQNQPPHHLF